MSSNTSMYYFYEKTVQEFIDEYQFIDCQPVGQRLPVYTKGNSKEVGIILSILAGESIGMITLMKIDSSTMNRKQRREFERTYKKESIDGGHRKRAIWAFYTNKFKVGGKFYTDLSDEERDNFLNMKLSFTLYNPLNTGQKGRIFRNLNKTTDVNFIEMLNSYGIIPVANYVREKVRLIDQINNPYHLLFSYHTTPKDEIVYDYLTFDNDRLKLDHLLARIVHRYVSFPKGLLGGTSDEQLETMYQQENFVISPSISTKIDAHLDFLRTMADCSRQSISRRGLTQHDFKVLSALHLYLVDTYKVFNINDAEALFKTFSTANEALRNKEGKFSKIFHSKINRKTGLMEKSGYTVNLMYTRYINAPQTDDKTTEAVSYLIKEMGDIEHLLDIKDPIKAFSMSQKRAKLAEQGFICAIDGMMLSMKDAHAGHIVAHTKGGKTVYNNLAMVRACHNIDMGTMNLNEYKETLPSVHPVGCRPIKKAA